MRALGCSSPLHAWSTGDGHGRVTFLTYSLSVYISLLFLLFPSALLATKEIRLHPRFGMPGPVRVERLNAYQG